MRVLFAVNNEKVSESIVKKYQLNYKEIISVKNVYYFNAIIKELQRNRNYDRIVISEDLEPYSNRNYEMIDKFLFEKLDGISDEAANNMKGDIPIILICTDRREKGEPILNKLFSIGIYNALIGADRTVDNLCNMIYKPRNKKEAKSYYRIDIDDSDYKADSPDEVNETEVQNIINHFKKLGKNENAYITSFNDVATQYTDQQLKLIVGYLPLNVRAVLEENCPAYQKLMIDSVKGVIKSKKEKAITTKNINIAQQSSNKLELINKTLQKSRITSPVVIPASVNTNNVKKIYSQPQDKEGKLYTKPTIVSGELRKKKAVIPKPEIDKEDMEDIEDYEDVIDILDIPEINVENNANSNIDDITLTKRDSDKVIDTQSDTDTPIKKRGRGRPPKVKPATAVTNTTEKKRGRGRPPKVQNTVVIENKENKAEEDIDIFDLGEEPDEINRDNEVYEAPEKMENNEYAEDVNLFDLGESQEDTQEEDPDEPQDDSQGEDLDITEEGQEEDINLFGLGDEENQNEQEDDLDLFNLGDTEPETESYGQNSDEDLDLFNLGEENSEEEIYSKKENIQEPISSYKTENYTEQNHNFGQQSKTDNSLMSNKSYDENVIANLLTSDRKVVAFVGTSKNGTSFLVNNVASLIASKGINTAILDLTKNKNAYYIYTQNDENLRKQAANCIEGLRRGAPNGIQAQKNLTVYTTLPNEEDGIEDYANILQTLVKNYSLVILDCDFNTDFNYFAQVQEIYLVQTYDILTIQPLTAFLRELEDKNVIDPNKLRVVVNKVLKVRNLDEKMIIGGISKYNSPDMSYQKDLFDVNKIMYTVIPFEDQTYAKYLEGLVNCNISLNGYSRGLLDALEILASVIYPLISKTQYGNGKGYNNYNNNAQTFNSNIDSTLNKMRNSF